MRLCVSLALLLAGAAWSQNVIVFPLSVGAWSESEPVISFSLVAWTSDRDAATTGLDIWGTDLRGDINFPICQDPGDQYHPAVSAWGGDALYVWQDGRAGGAPDIYGRFASLGGSFPIATSDDPEVNPRVWGRYVVYERDDPLTQLSSIWEYDASAKLNSPLVTTDGQSFEPDLSGYQLVWTAFGQSASTADGDIWTEDIRAGTPWQVSSTVAAKRHPRVSGDWVVYEQQSPNGDSDIYAHRLSDPTADAVPICTDSADQTVPAIWGNIVVWQDERDGISSIYGYDMTAGEEFRVSDTNYAVDVAPDVSQEYVVFERWERPNPDVFAAKLNFSTITGKVTLGDFVGDAQAEPLEILLWPALSLTPVSLPIRLDADGTFRAVTLLTGNYTVGIKPSHWLTQILPDEVTLSPGHPVSVELSPVNGDTNHDDSIGLSDLSLVLADFGMAGADEADLDGSGSVSINDLSIVLANFGMHGDTR